MKRGHNGGYGGPRKFKRAGKHYYSYGMRNGNGGFKAAGGGNVNAPYRRPRRNLVTAGFLGIETKFLDTSLGATALTAPTDSAGAEHDPSATVMISTPVQGDGEQERIGKKILIKSVQVKGLINIPQLEAQTDPFPATSVYVAIVLDTQTNGAQMNSEDCFKNSGAIALMASNPMKNLLFGKRFRIIKMKKMTLNLASASTSAVNNFNINGTQRQFNLFAKLNMQVQFNAGTTGVVANVIDNSLHVIAFANTVLTAPTIQYQARIRFQG